MRATGERWVAMLAADQREVLFSRASRRNVKAGTLVVRRGAPADELYVVISGKLKAGLTLARGRDTTFDFLGPNQVFGETTLFGGGTRTADIEAIEDCELLVLRRPEVLLAIRQEPEIATTLLQVMAERIASLSETIEDASWLDAGARFARSLLKLGERFGVQPLRQNLQIQLELSQPELADLVGVSHAFANAKLKAWEREGILTHESDRLTIHDVSRLRHAAGLPVE